MFKLVGAALAWPELRYTRATHDARPGPLEFTLKQKGTIRIPYWVGLVAIAGGTLLIWLRKKG